MARMRGGLILLLSLATAVGVLGGCGGDASPADGPSLRLTDPATVPTATPASEERVFRFEGGVVVPPGGPPTSGPTPPPTAGRTYIVQPGDTCVGIAEKLGVTVEALRNANPGIDAGCTNLQPNQELVVPGGSGAVPSPTPQPTAPGPGASGARTYTIQPGDTCYEIAQRYGVELEALIALNGLDCQALQPGQSIRIP